MSDQTPKTPAVPPPMRLGENGMYEMRDQTDVLRVARHLLSTGAAPASLGTAERVAMAVQGLVSLGLNPYASIRQVAFVNGAMTLWGELPLALVRKTTALEDFEEFRFCLGKDSTYQRQCYANSNCHLDPFGAVCRVKRRGQAMHEVVFTKADAERAGMWNRRGPWQSYPARMLQMRARSQALKDIFSDALSGVQIQEYDIEGVVAPNDGPRWPTDGAQGDAAAKTAHMSLMGRFVDLGISVEALTDFLGHSILKCSGDELELMTSMAVAIEAGEVTWDDAMQARQREPGGPKKLSAADKMEQTSTPPQDDAPKTAKQATTKPVVTGRSPEPMTRAQQLTRQLRQARRSPVPT